MSIPKEFWAGPLAAFAVAAFTVAPAHAEPLTPLTPNENQYLDQLHKVFTASHDPVFISDGELLTKGYFVCAKRATGQIGEGTTFTTPAIIQLAVIYLCP